MATSGLLLNCDTGNKTMEYEEDSFFTLSDFFEIASSSLLLDAYAYQERPDSHPYEDRISELPDELLIDIISRLSTKEAARTGVLRRRWEGLWALATGSLVCDTPKSFWHNDDPHVAWEAETAKYIKWVDDALASYQALSLGEFKIMFDMEDDRKNCIDKWILIAFSKRVNMILLHLCPCFQARRLYILSMQTLASTNITSLVSLTLSHVNVGHEVLQYIFSRCSLLEELSVENSDHLVNLKIEGGPLLKLKRFCLSRCYNLKSLYISAPNLTSFSIFSNAVAEVEIHVESTPKIQHVSIVSQLPPAASFPFAQLIAWLHTLKLGMFFRYNWRNNKKYASMFPKFRHLPLLRHLIWCVVGDIDFNESVLPYKYLIDAASFLDEFTLERDEHSLFSVCVVGPLQSRISENWQVTCFRTALILFGLVQLKF